MKLIFKQVEFFCLYRVSLKSIFFRFIFFFKVQTKGWTGVLVLYKTAYVVCCLFWLIMHRYLLRNQTKLGNGILYTVPKSTTLGPQLIFIAKFLEKAPFLAQNA